MQNVRKLITNLDFSSVDQVVNDLLDLSDSSFICFAEEDKQELEKDFKNSSFVLLVKTKVDNVLSLLNNSDISNEFDSVYIGLKADMKLSMEEFSDVTEKALAVLGDDVTIKHSITFVDKPEELNDITILAVKK